MTTALADSVIMLRRNLKYMVRYPSMTLFMVLMPVAFLLLFVYILSGTVGPAVHAGRAAYATFITPGILALTAVAATTSTAVSVATDMTGGIISRFRTMPVARVSMLAGHVGGAVIQTVLAMAAVTAVAVLTGFRSTTSVTGWLAAAATLVLFTFALTWPVRETSGLTSQVPETAGFPYEIGLLKRYKRTGWSQVGVPLPASVADHSFRALVIASILSAMEGADPQRAAFLALAKAG